MSVVPRASCALLDGRRRRGEQAGSEVEMAMRLFTASLRYMMAAASLGAVFGALLMFWLGASKLFGAIRSGAVSDPLATTTITTSVMGATDAFLFGVVLLTFAYALMFGLVINAPANGRLTSVSWTGPGGLSELKHNLIEVILIYMVVDFATDLVELEPDLSWRTLVVPLAIVLIAGALRLLGPAYTARNPDPPHRSDGPT
jgi:hypothetical protein